MNESRRIRFQFELYCPKCRAWDEADHAAAKFGNTPSAGWLLANWVCFCPTLAARGYDMSGARAW